MKQLRKSTHIPDGVAFDEALSRTTHLGIGAHQDDLEILYYHGIAQAYDSEDEWFGGVTVTDGAGSARTGPYAGVSDDEMKRIRSDEQKEAADIGRYSFVTQLGVPSQAIRNADASGSWVDELEFILRQTRPRYLYLHNPADKHPTHIAVLKACVSALRRLPEAWLPEKIWGCEGWRNLDWIRDLDKVVLPADGHPELAEQLIRVFRSQVAGGKDYVRAALGRRFANATFFQSHEVDQCQACIFALDLKPVLDDPSVDLRALVHKHLRHFEDDLARSLQG